MLDHHDDDTKVRSGGGSNSMEEGWRVQLSSSEATASDYEEVNKSKELDRIV